MSKSITIGLDLGNGLYIMNNDKVAVYYEPNGNMHLERDDDPTDGKNGMYVSNLKGPKGSNGDSRYDGYTTKPGPGWGGVLDPNLGSAYTTDFIDVDRSIVNMIFTIGLYKPIKRNATNITYSSTEVKDVTSICNEIVAPIYFSPVNGYTSYKPYVGELLQLITNPIFRITNTDTGTIATESINRIAATSPAQEVKVMFVITKIVYNSDLNPNGSQYWVNSMELQCIYSSIPNYIVGNIYSGSQKFDQSHI